MKKAIETHWKAAVSLTLKWVLRLLLGIGFAWAVVYGFVALLILLPYPAMTNVLLAAGFVLALWLLFIVVWFAIGKLLRANPYTLI
jgi:hypothetical protein